MTLFHEEKDPKVQWIIPIKIDAKEDYASTSSITQVSSSSRTGAKDGASPPRQKLASWTIPTKMDSAEDEADPFVIPIKEAGDKSEPSSNAGACCRRRRCVTAAIIVALLLLASSLLAMALLDVALKHRTGPVPPVVMCTPEPTTAISTATMRTTNAPSLTTATTMMTTVVSTPTSAAPTTMTTDISSVLSSTRDPSLEAITIMATTESQTASAFPKSTSASTASPRSTATPTASEPPSTATHAPSLAPTTNDATPLRICQHSLDKRPALTVPSAAYGQMNRSQQGGNVPFYLGRNFTVGMCNRSISSRQAVAWYTMEGDGNFAWASTIGAYDGNGAKKEHVGSLDCRASNMNTDLVILEGRSCDRLLCVNGGYYNYSLKTRGNCRNYEKREPYLRVAARWLTKKGMTYHVLVLGDRPDDGYFQLNVLGIPNQFCHTATELLPTNSTASGVTVRQMPREYFNIGDGNVWYSIRGTGGIFATNLTQPPPNQHEQLDAGRTKIYTSADNADCANNLEPVQLLRSWRSPSEQVSSVPFWDYIRDRKVWNSIPGQIYYLKLDLWTRGSNLRVEEHAPEENDSCGGALELTVGGEPIQGSTIGATPGGATSCDNNTYGSRLEPDLWYFVHGTGRALRVHGTIDWGSNLHYSDAMRMSLLIGGKGNCEDQQNMRCIIDTSPKEWDFRSRTYFSTLEWPSEVGVKYFIRVSFTRGFTVMGPFNLTLTEFDPVENDFCSGAIEVEAGGETYEGNFSGATIVSAGSMGSDEIGWYGRGWCGLSGYSRVWFYVVATHPTMQATINGTGVISVLKGACSATIDSFYCISYTPDDEERRLGVVAWPAQVGQGYYLVVPSIIQLQVRGNNGMLHRFCESAIQLTPNGPPEIGNVSKGGMRRALVWFSVIGDGRGFRAHLHDSDQGSGPYLLEPYEGNCGNLLRPRTAFANDDRNQKRWITKKGALYHFALGSDRDFEFSVSISTFPSGLHNCVCEDADTLAPGTVVEGVTIDRTHSYPSPTAGDQWYTIQGSNAILFASVDVDGNGYLGHGTIYRGDCSNLQKLFLLAVLKGGLLEGGQNIAQWFGFSGETYHLLIRAQHDVAFNISVDEKKPSVAHSNCFNALGPLSVGSATKGTVAGAYNTSLGVLLAGTDMRNTFHQPCIASKTSRNIPRVWYYIIGTGLGIHATLAHNSSLALEVYSSQCYEDDHCIVNDENFCPPATFPASQYCWRSVEGLRYHIAIHQNPAGEWESNAFELRVSEFVIYLQSQQSSEEQHTLIGRDEVINMKAENHNLVKHRSNKV